MSECVKWRFGIKLGGMPDRNSIVVCSRSQVKVGDQGRSGFVYSKPQPPYSLR